MLRCCGSWFCSTEKIADRGHPSVVIGRTKKHEKKEKIERKDISSSPRVELSKQTFSKCVRSWFVRLGDLFPDHDYLHGPLRIRANVAFIDTRAEDQDQPSRAFVIIAIIIGIRSSSGLDRLVCESELTEAEQAIDRAVLAIICALYYRLFARPPCCFASR
ncbi:fatty acid desaturase [Anopheles sinensis]|uniref:Fatty acid desaturase n=1 Tax=Anopheles sinensis TaxID=74873 RepID=A0A084W3Y4_ANOSI|nr:fatty acid desaturase [Anopheles sinensis]